MTGDKKVEPVQYPCLECRARECAADCGHALCHDRDPRRDGLVYCCVTIGWVTPAEAAEHRYDASFGGDNFRDD